MLNLLKASLFVSAAAWVMLPPVMGMATSRSLTDPVFQTARWDRVEVAQRSRTKRLQFKPGESSASIQTAVIRGTRDIYLLGAQRGQTMSIRIESLENNAVFDLEAPASGSGQRRMMKQEAVTWSGKLPATGDYRIVIGSTRGNAQYKLRVSIR